MTKSQGSMRAEWIAAAVAIASFANASAAEASGPPGSMVFSARPILFQQEDPSRFQSDFPSGSEVFGRAYFAPLSTPDVTKVVSVDGTEIGRFETLAQAGWETMQLPLTDNETPQGEALLKALSQGRLHKVKVVLIAKRKQIATGEFAYGVAGAAASVVSATDTCDLDRDRCASRSPPGLCAQPWIDCLMATPEHGSKCPAAAAAQAKTYFHTVKLSGDTVTVRCDGGYRTVYASGGSSDTGPLTDELRAKQAAFDAMLVCKNRCLWERNRCEKAGTYRPLCEERETSCRQRCGSSG